MLVFADTSITAGTGDVLADYIDAGGHVVVAGDTFNALSPLAGRFATDGYYPLTTNGVQVTGKQEFLETVAGTQLTGHFLLNNVASFDGKYFNLLSSQNADMIN